MGDVTTIIGTRRQECTLVEPKHLWEETTTINVKDNQWNQMSLKEKWKKRWDLALLNDALMMIILGGTQC